MISRIRSLPAIAKIIIIAALFAVTQLAFTASPSFGFVSLFVALVFLFEGFTYVIVPKFKMSLFWKILFALTAGIIIAVFEIYDPEQLVKMRPLGSKIFMNLMTMALVPLVFCSILTGVTSLGDVKKLNRIGGRTLTYYLATTAIAITIGLTLANVIQPGHNIPEDIRNKFEAENASTAESKVNSAKTNQKDAFETLQSIVPKNIMSTVSGPKPEMLALIFFAIFCGFALLRIQPEVADPVIKFATGVTEMTVELVGIVMHFAPYGIFAIITSTIAATEGFDLLFSLIPFSVCVLLGLFCHGFITNALSLMFLSKRPVIETFKKMREVGLIAFSTASSGGTLPYTLKTAKGELGVKDSVASFVIPLGATINMDGTALFQGVSAIFLANIYGIDLNIWAQLTVIGMAVMASIGTAAVPGVGIVILTMILVAVDIPPEGILFILPVNNILDMFRTSVNVVGDMTCSIYIDTCERKHEAANG